MPAMPQLLIIELGCASCSRMGWSWTAAWGQISISSNIHELQGGKSPCWTSVSELKGIVTSTSWYCCYLVISTDTNTVFPLLSLCGGVRKGVLSPPLFAFPSKGLCEECREFNWSRRIPVWLPALWSAHVLGAAKLPETGHQLTTPPWETEQDENTFTNRFPALVVDCLRSHMSVGI